MSSCPYTISKTSNFISLSVHSERGIPALRSYENCPSVMDTASIGHLLSNIFSIFFHFIFLLIVCFNLNYYYFFCTIGTFQKKFSLKLSQIAVTTDDSLPGNKWMPSTLTVPYHKHTHTHTHTHTKKRNPPPPTEPLKILWLHSCY